jgi:hypothetical protein
VVIPRKEKYIQASWQKEIFSVDLFFSKARFFGFLLNSSAGLRFGIVGGFFFRIGTTLRKHLSAQALIAKDLIKLTRPPRCETQRHGG